MSRSARYATIIVVAHLLINIVHGVAHQVLRVGLSPLGSIFVIAVVLISPLIAAGMLWTQAKNFGLILLSLSMFGSFLFGLYHHFLMVSPDHIHSQPPGGWGSTFIATSYLLLITEAIGSYAGVHFFRSGKQSSSQTFKA
jgi:hypothetical protein